jgi:hypothetical protein
MACASGARNPFDQDNASAGVGQSPGTEGSSSDGSTGGPGSGDASGPTTATSGSDSTSMGSEAGDGSPCEDADDCDDGDACTQATCDPVIGCQITAVNCANDDLCTTDVCDPVLGCVHDPVDCDDGDACTMDACDPAVGCLNEAIDCDDGISCTQDSCDGQSGQCVHTPDDAACDDANACNGVESCSAMAGCVMGTPVVCNDGNACTQDVCNPQSGACSHPAINACAHNDGCCPVGCSVNQDNDCVCANLAGSATPTTSGGGQESTGYGPSNLNDGVSKAQCIAMGCNQCFSWISNSSTSTGWFQLEWNSAVTIGSIYVEGEHATNPSCSSTSRNMAAGDVQWWNGNAWVTATSWVNNVEDLFFEFSPPLQTTRIRLANVLSGPSSPNSMAFEWFVYEPLGCTP